MRVDPTPYWHNLVQEDVPWTRSWSSSRWSIWSVLGAGRNTTGGASPIACIPTCTQSTHNCTSLRTLCVRDTLYSLWDESAEFGLMWGQLGGGWGDVRGGREGAENQEKTNIFCFKIFPVVCKSHLLWTSLPNSFTSALTFRHQTADWMISCTQLKRSTNLKPRIEEQIN